MKAQLEREDTRGHFRVVGELSFGTVPELDESSRALFADLPSLRIDLGAVQRSDSAGLALLTEWASRAREAGQALSFTRMPDQMCELVRVSGLGKVLPFADVDEARFDATLQPRR